MKEESHNPPIDPELEARVVALVLGEASDFECAALERLIEERPELASLREQLQIVHGLLRDVATGESVAEDDDWKLSAEKRNVVLAVINGEATAERSSPQVVNKPVEPTQRRTAKRNLVWNLARVAAVFCAVAITGSFAVTGLLNRSLSPSSDRPMAVADQDLHDQGIASPFFYDSSVADPMMRGDSKENAEIESFQTEYKDMDSMSALDQIRDSLSSVTPGQVVDESDMPSSGVVGSPRSVASAPKPGEAGSAESPRAGENSGQPSDEMLETAREATSRSEITAQMEEIRAVQNGGAGEIAFPKFSGRPGYGLPFEPAELQPAGAAAPPPALPGDGLYALGGSNFDSPNVVANPESRSARASSQSRGYGDENGQKLQPPGFAHGDVKDIDLERAINRPMRIAEGQETARGESIGLGAGVARGNTGGFRGDGEAAATESSFSGNGIGGFGGGGGGMGGGTSNPIGKSLEDNRKNEIFADNAGEIVTRASTGRAPVLAILDLPFPDDADELPAKDGFDASKVTVADLAAALGPRIAPGGSKEIRIRRSTVDAERDGPSLMFGLDPLGSPKVDDPDGRTSRELLGGDMEAAAGGVMSRPRPGKKPVGADEQLEGSAGLWANKSGQVGGESLPEQSKRDTRWRYDRDPTNAILLGSTRETRGKFDVQPQSSRTGLSSDIGDRVKDSLNGLSELSGLHKQNYEDTHDYSTKFAEEERKLPRQSGQQSIPGQDHWSGYVPPGRYAIARSGGESASRKMPLEKRSRIPDGLNEKTADNENFSTFSLHVSDVSFKLARAALANGVWPEAEKVRIEEFVNALDYGDPLPSQNEKVACCLEQSIHPFLQQRNLLRISMRTAAAGRASNTPLRLTFLLDNSGSMDRIDRQKTVRRCFALLAEQLTPIDQVTLISFARLPRLLADKVSGSESRMLVQLLDNLPSEGGTNIEAALKLAFEKAQEQRLDNAQNRIILLTDGAVNLGNANPDSLSRMIAKMRNAGIAFDAAGISAIGLNDEILEALTRQGDGRYYLLDSPDDADSGFVRQIAGALRPSAKNVKVQVEFNPKRVGRYKLLGFENRRLKKEDFRNDTVDAAEMAAAEAGVAMYQFEAKPDGEGDVGSVSVRFRDLSTGLMIEERWPIPYQAGAPRADQAAPSLRIASSAALFAAKLRGEPLGESVDLKTLFNLISGLPEPYRNADRVQQLQLMIQQARQVSGE